MSRAQAWWGTALWTWFVALIIWREWHRPALDQGTATVAYVLAWVFGVVTVWAACDEDE